MAVLRARTRAIGVAILATMIGAAHARAALGEAPAGPHIVMIIRHAEKTSEKTDAGLSKKGYERADALATVLPAHFPRPDFLIAAKRSKNSNRSVETITPLSKVLHEEIESKFKDKEYNELAHELLTDPKYAGKTVLIAWHHGKLPELAKALGAKDVPDRWEDDVFNRVWEITYEKGAAKFKDLPENALPEDSAAKP
jgi:phosphohistidine phosphatase SixA